MEITRTVDQSLVEILNRYVGEKLAACSQYVAIALFCEGRTLRALAHYFFDQSTLELTHVERAIRYIQDMGIQPIVPAVRKPQIGFSDPTACVRKSLELELEITDTVNHMIGSTITSNDARTRDLLRGFVMEQLAEVAALNELLDVMNGAGEGHLSLVEKYVSQIPHLLGS